MKKQKSNIKKSVKIFIVLSIFLVIGVIVLYVVNTPRFQYKLILNKAEKYFENEDYEEALEFYLEAADIYGGKKDLKNELIECNLLLAEEAMSKLHYKDAIEFYEEALDYEKNNVEALSGRVEAFRAEYPRTNNLCPVERVYDYADVLTTEEEEQLRKRIAEIEPQIQADIVLVIISEPMESSAITWENAMMNCADDFYDFSNYGYDEESRSGALLLDNWYEGQAGSWLSTCGAVYEEFGMTEIHCILDEVYYGLDKGNYDAYSAYVEKVYELMGE